MSSWVELAGRPCAPGSAPWLTHLAVRLAACGLFVGVLAAVLWWAVDLLAQL